MPPELERIFNTVSSLLPANARDGLDMGLVLDTLRPAIPLLLAERDEWRSVLIDYERPYLMRLFRTIPLPDGKTLRLNLHHFFAGQNDPAETWGITNPYAIKSTKHEGPQDETNLNLYHPHPWAAAFNIHSGKYKQLVARAPRLGLEHRPSQKDEQWIVQNTGSQYAFNDPHIWHMVLPENDEPVSTTMLTYIPQDWGQKSPASPYKLRELNENERAFMFDEFERFYAQPDTDTKDGRMVRGEGIEPPTHSV
jgi:hypothetical protein